MVNVALCLVIVGQIFIGTLVWAGAVAAFWVNALAVLGRRRRTVIDRVAGTVVVRPVVRARVPAHAVELALKTSDIAQVASLQGAEFAFVVARIAPKAFITGKVVCDAAQATGHQARESADVVMASALNSRVGQRAPALGTAGARLARQAWIEG